MLELAPRGFEEVDAGRVVELVAYTDRAGEARIRAAFAHVASEPLRADWETRWRAFHRPVRSGGIWIGPPWEQRPVGLPTVVIEPGRAFGTGAHPTTRLCLELLAARERRGSLLDVGCGSGVIAIAAARLGYGPVTAVDADPVAVDVTRANAVLNRVGLDVCVLDATSAALPRADVVVANVSAAVVAAVLAGVLARESALDVVTSGYLAGERLSAPGWAQLEHRTEDGWAADLFRRVSV
jgi:ribosomal protein L11 methyltransferase